MDSELLESARRASKKPDPVPLRSVVNLDSIEIVSIAILVERLGRLAEARMREVCAALAIAVNCSD